MLARLQQGWVLVLTALAFAAAVWALQLGASIWVAFAVVLAVFNLHAWALACEFAWLRRVDPGSGLAKPTPPELWRAWWGEVLTGLRVFMWRQPFRSKALPDHLPSAQGRRGVLMLHGFVCNRGLWNPWMRRLRQADVPYLAINMEPVFDSIDRYVAAIDAAVQRLEEATLLPPVIVAHSMGGLAIRAWLRHGGAEQRAHSIITIGTPHAGTWLARFAMARNARQMREGNDWLRDLAAGEPRSARALFTCYFGHCDNIVFPAHNATLEGASNRHVPGVAHVHLAFHPPIFDDVLSRTRA